VRRQGLIINVSYNLQYLLIVIVNSLIPILFFFVCLCHIISDFSSIAVLYSYHRTTVHNLIYFNTLINNRIVSQSADQLAGGRSPTVMRHVLLHILYFCHDDEMHYNIVRLDKIKNNILIFAIVLYLCIPRWL